MTQPTGWYLTKLYDPNEAQIDIDIAGAPVHVFSPWFVHRSEDGARRTIDSII